MPLKEPSQTASGVTIKLFDRILVKISIEAKNVQHQKMKLDLVSPRVSNNKSWIFQNIKNYSL